MGWIKTAVVAAFIVSSEVADVLHFSIYHRRVCICCWVGLKGLFFYAHVHAACGSNRQNVCCRCTVHGLTSQKQPSKKQR